MQFEEKDDFFDGPDVPEPVKEPKKPALSPEDPDFWDEPESEWEHLEGSRSRRLRIWLIAALVLLALLIWGYFRFFTPYIDDATQYGYVDSIESHKSLITTFEGVLIPFKELHDTTRVYQGDFRFSTNTDAAIRLRGMMYSGKPVRVSYRRYRVAAPWRGESKTVVTAVDSVSPDSIMPYLRLPESVR